MLVQVSVHPHKAAKNGLIAGERFKLRFVNPQESSHRAVIISKQYFLESTNILFIFYYYVSLRPGATYHLRFHFLAFFFAPWQTKDVVCFYFVYHHHHPPYQWNHFQLYHSEYYSLRFLVST